RVICKQRRCARSRPSLHRDAGPIRKDLAVTVSADTAAGPVAKVLGASHGAGEASRVQDALATHAAIPDRLFERLLDGNSHPLDDAHAGYPLRSVLSIRSTACSRALLSAAWAAPTMAFACRVAIEASGE